MNEQKIVTTGWLGCVAVVWLLATAWPVVAADFYWINTGGGDYAVGANWSGNVAPGAGDTTYFTNNADYAVSWSADATASNVYFNPKSGTVTLNPGSAVWTVANAVSLGESAGTTGTVVQTSGKIVANGTMVVGNNGQGFYTLSNGTIVAGASRICSDSRMVVTGSGSAVTNTGLTTVGYYAPRAGLTVTDGGFLRAAAGLVIGGGRSSATGCMTVVTGTGVVSTTTLSVGGGGYGDSGGFHQLVVTNGGKVYASSIAKIGIDSTAPGNVMVVTGQGSVYSNTASYTSIGASSPNNQLIITNGGSVFTGELDISQYLTSSTNNLVLVSGSNSTLNCSGNVQMGSGGGSITDGAKYNRLIVNNGAQASLTGALYLGYPASAGGQEVTVSDPGTVLNVNTLLVGDRSAGNRLVVTNGGRVNINSALTVSNRGTGTASNNTVVVTGANSMLWLTRTGGIMYITVGGTGSGGLLLTDQGILEITSNSRFQTGAYGTITNWGGIFQFAGGIDNNTVYTNGTPGSIVITNGTVSFRAFTTADVFCNQSGQPLDSTNKMVWLGDNTFRLNNATNVAGQNYTFQTGTPTNFAGLSLINGSRYRGNVTVGTGGTLSCSDGPETLAGSLTMQSDATLALTLAGSNDTLTVTGAVNLAGAQLQVTLNADPTPYYPIRFLRTGGLGGSKFSTRTIEAQYRGTNFGMKVRYDANNQDVLLYDEGVKGTLLLLY